MQVGGLTASFDSPAPRPRTSARVVAIRRRLARRAAEMRGFEEPSIGPCSHSSARNDAKLSISPAEFRARALQGGAALRQWVETLGPKGE